MKKLIAGLVSAILFTATAQAGRGPSIEDVLVTTDPANNLTRVQGNLAGVRFTEDDVQQIGCLIRANRFGPTRVSCFARDINANDHFCFSFDPALIEAAKSISPFSFVRFEFFATTEFPECESLLVSVRSHHIPDADMEKGKIK